MSQAANCGILIVIGGVLLLLTTILLTMSATTVEAGHIGVVKAFGKIKDEGLTPGLHWVNPITDSVTEIDTRINSLSYSSGTFSSDIQEVQSRVAVQYSLVKVMVPEALNKIGTREKIETVIIEKAIAESLKL